MQTVVVLGMHKSGTSLVAEMLHHSGIEMIEEMGAGGYDEGQKYERREPNLINKALLDAEGVYSLEVRHELRLDSVDPAMAERARVFVESMTRRGVDWGFKDPRTCLTYGFWKHQLPPHQLLCVFRDFEEVHHRYRGRQGYVGSRVIDAWYRYNAAMLEAYRGAPPGSRMLVNYQDLMGGAEPVQAVGAFLGRPLVDRRNHGMRRTVRKGDMQTWKDGLLYLAQGRNIWRLNRRLRALARADQASFASRSRLSS